MRSPWPPESDPDLGETPRHLRPRGGARTRSRRSRAAALVGFALAFAVAHGTVSADVDTLDRPAECCDSAWRVDPPDPARRAESVGLIGDSLAVGLTDDRFQNGPTNQAVVESTGRSMW